MKDLIVSLVFLVAAAICTSAQAGATFHQDVSWSPDGKYLAFTGLHDYVKGSDAFNTDIYTIRSDGSGQTKITDDAKNEYYTSMSKKRIAYSSGAKGTQESDIYTANYDGSDIRQVTKGGGRNSTPAFSPDGKRIAFVSTRDGEKYQIYVMNADGSGVRRLTTDAAVGFFNPQWSPDGKRIVYYAEKGDQKDQVWVMRSDGSAQTLLTGGVGHNIFPGWSRDGKRIIFSSSNRDGSGGSFVNGSYLYTVNADGSGLAHVGKIKSFFARFSPDGKKIAYIAGAFPSTSIFIANADGSDIRQLTK